ncbi:CYFA0S13e03510g1_1 [Cyberlindnera fabianii]|uniref:Cytidine deaminase n=1 Tax=Cyberlindnera fabianii TaxID=36022 RepID=A0A061B887_CYBFA|nr:Cytidine deaminase [Cyberlindnera fabianii]CDR44105.1 CYFA0S13e03510g1_1 [Cyberlindnera fabianii]
MQEVPGKLSIEEFTTLRTKAIGALDLSYSPYSKFRVGCALLSESGDLFVGANVENASYGAAICAERSTIVTAVLQGHRKFKAIGVSSDMVDEFISPCGICRQSIREFGKEIEVYMFKKDGSCVMKTLEELLPMSFGPEQLN